jgi:hypothetical protein
MRSRASLTGDHHAAGGAALKKWITASLALAVTGITAPATAAGAATLTVDPVAPCYRELSEVHLIADGFTPGGMIAITRDGQLLDEPIQADSAGMIEPTLRLPGFVRGQRLRTYVAKQLRTYVATDQGNPALRAQVSVLVTATSVALQPQSGPPSRPLRISARGFFGGRTLFAHVVRRGKHAGRPHNMRVGRVRGDCMKVHARKRLFERGTGAGRYLVQFDTFRRYKAGRKVESEFIVTVSPKAGTAQASSVGVSPAS